MTTKFSAERQDWAAELARLRAALVETREALDVAAQALDRASKVFRPDSSPNSTLMTEALDARAILTKHAGLVP
jgi:hypothetical protein